MLARYYLYSHIGFLVASAIASLNTFFLSWRRVYHRFILNIGGPSQGSFIWLYDFQKCINNNRDLGAFRIVCVFIFFSYAPVFFVWSVFVVYGSRVWSSERKDDTIRTVNDVWWEELKRLLLSLSVCSVGCFFQVSASILLKSNQGNTTRYICVVLVYILFVIVWISIIPLGVLRRSYQNDLLLTLLTFNEGW